MSGVSWTEDQKKVIETHNRNLLVSAAAGSGKTAVLVQRIVEMVTDAAHPMDVDELLVVTFTNAAAAEMRERVAAALASLLDENPQDRHLKRQNTLIHQAQITTIDSFCLYVIRNYFNQLDIDPSFRIGDEGELKLLSADVMEEMLEDYYQSEDKDFSDFVETYARGKGDYGIDAYIYQVHNFARSTPWPQEWFEACRREVALEQTDDLEKMPWVQYLLEDARRQAEELLGLVQRAKEVCREEKGPEVYLDAFLDDERLIAKILGAGTYETLTEVLAGSGTLTRLKAVRSKDVDPAKKEEASGIRAQIKQILTKMRKLYAAGSGQDVITAMQGCRPAVLTLLRLAEEYGTRYQAAKKEKNLVDFSDLEHFAIQILLREENGERVPTEAAKQLSSQYKEILIDEYQDSNLVQETLLNSISREREGSPNVFMVGDVKQSIYRFRLARPELFLHKYETYTREDSKYQKIELHQNFRSREEILESANQVFWKLMIRTVGGIAYTKEHALYPGASFEELPQEQLGMHQTDMYRTELVLCDTSDAGKTVSLEDGTESKIAEDKEEFTAKEAEAHLIAKRIQQIVDEETGMLVWDKKEKKYRRARYRDIVVLCRSMAGWSEIFTNVFMNSEIPAVAETRTGYFNTIEVETILSFLSVLDNPMQDIPLAAVLHSPVGGLSDRELAELMAGYKKLAHKGEDRGLYGAYAAAVYGVPKKSEEELEQKIQSELGGDAQQEAWETYLAQRELEEWQIAEAERNPDSAPDYFPEYEKISGQENTQEGKREAESEAVQEREFPVLSEALMQKVRKLEEMLDILRRRAQYLPIHELLYAIYEETGYYRYVSAMPAGAVRAANLDMLAEKAAAYEATSYRGVFHFIRYIEKLKSYDTDFGEASLAGEEDDAVRMMSIHKSKGLEFPIVFLAGMGKKFNKMDIYGKVLIDPEMGIAVDYLDLESRVRFATLKKQVLKRRLEVENLGEELRVLYVAMTRAKEKLIMTAAVPGLEKKILNLAGKNQGEVLFTNVVSASSYLDWMFMSFSGDIREILTAKEKKVPFGWIDVKTVSMEELVKDEVVQQAERKLRRKELLEFDTEREYDSEMRAHLERVMGFVYPHEADIFLHTKMAVSELKKTAYQMDVEEAAWLPSLPEFMKKGEAEEKQESAKKSRKQIRGGAERGTMYHHVLELLPVAEIPDELLQPETSELAAQGKLELWTMQEVEKLAARGKIMPEEKEIVEYPALARFLRSDLGRRMARAAKQNTLYREKQFVIGIPAKDIPGLAESEEFVVIQGIIDAWFVEDGEMILVDYKTDRVFRDGEHILRERYQAQLDYYEKALSQMTGRSVKEKWIYSFALNKGIRM